jgi:hypothetical protein
VVSSNDDEPPRTGPNSDFEDIFSELSQPELERLAIDAIREYRASVARAETTRLELLTAEADAGCCPHRRAELQRIHEHAEAEHRVRQLILNNLVNRLGYVPKVSAA